MVFGRKSITTKQAGFPSFSHCSMLGRIVARPDKTFPKGVDQPVFMSVNGISDFELTFVNSPRNSLIIGRIFAPGTGGEIHTRIE